MIESTSKPWKRVQAWRACMATYFLINLCCIRVWRSHDKAGSKWYSVGCTTYNWGSITSKAISTQLLLLLLMVSQLGAFIVRPARPNSSIAWLQLQILKATMKTSRPAFDTLVNNNNNSKHQARWPRYASSNWTVGKQVIIITCTEWLATRVQKCASFLCWVAINN